MRFAFCRLWLSASILSVSLACAAGVESVRPPQMYFADFVNSEVSPVTVQLNLEKTGCLALTSKASSFLWRYEIAWNRISSLSYAPAVTPAVSGGTLKRVLTIGFSDDQAVHHNLVVLLNDESDVNLLSAVEKFSGRTISRP